MFFIIICYFLILFFLFCFLSSFSVSYFFFFLFSSRRRHTSGALVTEFRRVLFRSHDNGRQATQHRDFPSPARVGRQDAMKSRPWQQPWDSPSGPRFRGDGRPSRRGPLGRKPWFSAGFSLSPTRMEGPSGLWRPQGKHDRRSEEHTSELQSLMRISYAVLCLKKK